MSQNVTHDALKASARVAVIGCESPSSARLLFRGKRMFARELISVQMKELGLDPILHHPAADANDFPKKGAAGAVIIGGSSHSLFDDEIAKHGWMQRLLDFIRETHGNVPMLGLCFGHQAIARAFGAELKPFYKDIFYEVGFSHIMLKKQALSDPLFKGMPKRFPALFSHYCYVPSLPSGASLLALSANPNNPSIQAFKLGDSTWGIQYHPEYTPELIRDLLLRQSETLAASMNIKAALDTLRFRLRQDQAPLKNFARLASSI